MEDVRSLLFGCILRCLDPVLTVAAILTARTVFVAPQDRLAEAKAYGGRRRAIALRRFSSNRCVRGLEPAHAGRHAGPSNGLPGSNRISWLGTPHTPRGARSLRVAGVDARNASLPTRLAASRDPWRMRPQEDRARARLVASDPAACRLRALRW